MGVIKSIVAPEAYRVYQRSANDNATIELLAELSKPIKGTVEAKLTIGRTPASGFDWKKCQVNGTEIRLKLESVPVGGPYTLELRVLDGDKAIESRRIPGILVGDIWILAGQSNMDGYGKLDHVEQPSRYVNCFYYGDKWGVAKDPLCWLNESIDPVHWSIADPVERAASIKFERAFRDWGAGLGVRFGKDMWKATGVPVGLIMCSHGGTSMNQWSPALKDKGGDSLYGCMIRMVNAVGGKVAGCLWYQGESETNEESAGDFKQKFRSFIETVRKDLNHPNLPFFYVQLSRFFQGEPIKDYWNSVQNDQLLLEGEMKNVGVVAAIDCSLADIIHIDAVSGRRIGARLAKVARNVMFGHDVERGPRPGKIEFLDNSRKKIRISFTGVNGSLLPVRNIKGFFVEKDNEGIPIKSSVRGKEGKSIVITLANPAPAGANLWYGRGVAPCVNVVDKADLAVPVFGPIELP